MAKKSVKKKKQYKAACHALAKQGKWNNADGSYGAIPSSAGTNGGMVRGYRGGFKLGPG